MKLYDIMGQDCLIYATLEKNGEVTIEVNDEDGNTVFKETSHIAAWESLVYFARQVLDENERIERKLEDR